MAVRWQRQLAAISPLIPCTCGKGTEDSPADLLLGAVPRSNVATGSTSRCWTRAAAAAAASSSSTTWKWFVPLPSLPGLGHANCSASAPLAQATNLALEV